MLEIEPVKLQLSAKPIRESGWVGLHQTNHVRQSNLLNHLSPERDFETNWESGWVPPTLGFYSTQPLIACRRGSPPH